MCSAKRRKLDNSAQELALQKATARAAARARHLEHLDEEESSINSGSHPLLDATYSALASEKAMRLAHLEAFQNQEELSYDHDLDVNTELAWKNWAVSRCTVCCNALLTLRCVTGCQRYSPVGSLHDES